MALESLVEMEANVKLELTPADLQMFAESIAQRMLMAYDDGQLEQAARREDDETYYNTKQVREMFNVCDTTLNLWAKRGYLVPVKFGNKNMYTKTDIDRIRTGNRQKTISAFCRKRSCNYGDYHVKTYQPPPRGSEAGLGIRVAVGGVSAAGAGDYLQPCRL